MSFDMGKVLMVIGGLLFLAGVILYFTKGVIPFGRLPGDIKIEGKNSTFYFPLTTSILISAILSLVGYLIKYLKK